MALDHAGGGQAEADTKDRVQPIRSVLSKLYVTREELQLFHGAVSKLNHHGLADLQPVLVSRLIGGLLPFESLAASGPTRVLQSQLIVRRLTGVQACKHPQLVC